MKSGTRRSTAKIVSFGAPLLTAVLLLAPAPARAAACCLSAGVFGVGRLVVWEEFAVGTSVSVMRAQGLWDADARFRSYGGDYQELESTADVYGLVRFGDRVQGFARMPWVFTQRSAPGYRELGSALGDLQAGVRFEPVQIGEYEELPAVALTASVLAPSGIRPEDSGTSLGTATSGRGVWAAALGLSLEHVQAPWFVRLDMGGSVSLPFHRDDLDVDQAYGPSLQVGLFGGRELIEDRWVLAVGATQEWEAPFSIDGTTVPDSSARSPSASLSTSLKLAPHWMVQATGVANVWADGLGKNRLGRFGGSVGVRYGYF